MVRYLVLWNWTDQGIKNVSETPSRAEAFAKAAQKSGATVKSFLWTIGSYDGAVILEAPDEQTGVAVLARLGSLGNVRTQTLRAFDRAEIEPILAKAK